MPENELKEGMHIQLIGDKVPSELKDVFWKIKSKEGLEYTHEFDSAVSSGGESGYQTIEKLEPDERPFHLFYVLFGFKDGCEYQVKIPTGTNRFGIDEDKDVARLSNMISPWNDPNPNFAFYLIHDMYPAINAINNTPRSITPKVYFRGEKYDLEKETNGDKLEKLKNYETRETPYIPSKKITLGGVE